MHYPHTAYRSESHLSSALYPVYQAHGDSEITDHGHTQLKQVTSLTEYESRDLYQAYQPRYVSTLDHQRQFLGYGRPITVGAPSCINSRTASEAVSNPRPRLGLAVLRRRTDNNLDMLFKVNKYQYRFGCHTY